MGAEDARVLATLFACGNGAKGEGAAILSAPFRANLDRVQPVHFEAVGEDDPVTVMVEMDGATAVVGGAKVGLLSATSDASNGGVFEVDVFTNSAVESFGRRVRGRVVPDRTDPYQVHVFTSGSWGGHWQFRMAEPKFLSAEDGGSAGGLAAPMPGQVSKVMVEVGERVEKGQALVVVIAMKMEHIVAAPYAGVVKEVLCDAGQSVPAKLELVSLTKDE